MTTARHRFINFLLKECSGLNYVLLKYIYDDVLFMPSEEKLELLIDKEDYKPLLYVVSSAKEITSIRSKRNVSSQIIGIKFSDHSSLDLIIKVDIERNGIVLMNLNEVLRHSVMTRQNIKIPVSYHQFEYVLLSGLLNKIDVEERFRNYFTGFSFEERSKIFAHICPKYKFILNILDELYTFNDSNYFKILETIKTQKQNKGLRYMFHKFIFVYDYLITGFIKGWRQFNNNHTSSDQVNGSGEMKNLLQRNALIRN